MTDNTNLQTLGFKDMHPEQMRALIDFMDLAFNCAHPDSVDGLLEVAEDVVVLFGGVGIEVKYDVDY
jgi:hypothetical protein